MVLRPEAFLKLMFCCHSATTEIGGFGISSQSHPLVIESFALLKQQCTAVTVSFEDQAVADHVEHYLEEGVGPERSLRVWIHTHPGASATPSSTDEMTFARSFGACDWSAMVIQSRSTESYARVQFPAGPGGQMIVPLRFDWASLPTWLNEQGARLPEIVRSWAEELAASVHVVSTPQWAETFDSDIGPVRRGAWFDEEERTESDRFNESFLDDFEDLDSIASNPRRYADPTFPDQADQEVGDGRD